MTDAPNKMWAFPYGDDWPELHASEGGFWWHTVADTSGGTEYVRADTITVLRDELREARELLERAQGILFAVNLHDGCVDSAIRAFLAKTQPKGADT